MRQATADIHSTAIIDPTAIIKDDVRVGPYAIVGAGVTVGEGSRIYAHAVLERGTPTLPCEVSRQRTRSHNRPAPLDSPAQGSHETRAGPPAHARVTPGGR